MTILFGAFVIFMLIGMPIGFVLLGASFSYIFVEGSIPFVSFVQRVASGTQSFPLMAVLLFVLMGNLLNTAKISTRIMNFAHALTAPFTGGLAQVNIVLSMLLSGMSGSANGDAVMQAKMLVPEMEEHGYKKPFAAVVTAASSLISPMIPPGIGLIVYGFVSNVSIGDLFVAGIIPGILMTVGMMVVTYFVSKKRGYGHDAEPLPPLEILKEFIKAIPALMLIVIIMVGIRMGVFTPTEAGAAACVYTFVLGLIYREFTIKNLLQCFRDTVSQAAGIMLILAASSAFSYILTIEQVPQNIAAWLLTVTQQPQLMMFLIFIFMVIAGMFLEGTSGIMILGPLFTPIAIELGVNPVQFGILMVFTLQLGGITPPVGTIMYAVCSIIKVTISDFVKDALPYYAALFIIAILLILVPQLSIGLL